MNKRLRDYIEQEFKNTKPNQEINELKDELLSNLQDKYDTFINEGYTDDQAFIESVKSIGNLKAVLTQYDEKKSIDLKNANQKMKQFSLISYMLLIVSIGIFIGFTMWLGTLIGTVAQVIIVLFSITLFLFGILDYNRSINDCLSKKDLENYISGKKKTASHLFYYIISIILTLTILYPLLGTQRSMIPFYDLILFIIVYLIVNETYKNVLKSYTKFSLINKALIYGLVIFIGLFISFTTLINTILVITIFLGYTVFDAFFNKKHIPLFLFNKIFMSLFMVYGILYDYYSFRHGVELDIEISENYSLLLFIALAVMAITLISILAGLIKLKRNKIYRGNFYEFIYYLIGVAVYFIIYNLSFHYEFLILLVFLIDYDIRKKIEKTS